MYFLTNQPDKASELIQSYNIKNYICKYAKNEELSQYLKNASYGFVLRDDNIVNNVATPTKFSTYLSYGVVPIYSSCIKGFDSAMDEKKCKVRLNSLNINECFDKVIDMINKDVPTQIIIDEYQSIFNTYYNTEKYIVDISYFLKRILEKRNEN